MSQPEVSIQLSLVLVSVAKVAESKVMPESKGAAVGQLSAGLRRLRSI